MVKFQGEFVWHDHKDTDEVFFVPSGEMELEFRDVVVHAGASEMFVIPQGVEHHTHAVSERQALLVETQSVVNTGDDGGMHTAANDVWV